MKIVFLSNHMKFSGGRMLMFLYAEFLSARGHDVKLLVKNKIGDLSGTEATAVPSFLSEHIPSCDLIVATSPEEVKEGYESGKGAKVVHFCQGFDLVDMEHRIQGKFLPPRYQGSGFWHGIKMRMKKRQWKRTLRKWDEVYRLPTYFISVSEHISEELEKRYGKPALLCRNGVDLKILHPLENWEPPQFSAKRPMKIVNVGSYNVTYKGLPVTYEAIGVAKKRGIPIDLIRISKDSSEFEKDIPFDFKLIKDPSRVEFGRILRSCDVYLSNSTEREGFGLPAMESMASGLVDILSDISCYRSFCRDRDFCLFVPEGDAKATADAIEKIYKMSPEEFINIRNTSLEVASTFSQDLACLRFEEILNNIYESEGFHYENKNLRDKN
ncbi:MAG: glycosyltransferase family 4 protein [Lentisphaerae bacterium]|nr:glycosyltransferase family 4 protein [Lentisphaerota bacterium]